MTSEAYCECGCGQRTEFSIRNTPSGGVKGEPNRFVRGHNTRINRDVGDGLVCCRDCARSLTRNAFYRSKSSANGLQGICKDCSLTKRNEWARANRERVRQRDRDWRAGKPGYSVAKLQEQRAKFPEKVAARRKLEQAVHRGHVAKPSTCEDCGGEFEARLIHGHHEDYSCPLAVVWLCPECHAHRHREAA